MARKALGRGLEALIPNPRELLSAPTVEQKTDVQAGSMTQDTTAATEPTDAGDTGATAVQSSSPPAGGAGTGIAVSPLRPASTAAVSIPARAMPASGVADPKRALASGRASVVIDVALDRIKPNPYQPREHFDDGETEELAASIRSKGLLQPVLLRRQGVGYELIAGERRLRAARRAELTTVPAIVRDASDREVLELALIENEQRVGLTPIESARSYTRALEEFQLTQSELADVLGRDRSTVSNVIRLLRLPEKVQAMIEDRRLSLGHARALLALDDPKRCHMIAERTVKHGLSVRAVERLVQAGARRRTTRVQAQDTELYPFEERLRRRFATQVHIRRRNGRGRIEIEFYNASDLERILEELGALRDA